MRKEGWVIDVYAWQFEAWMNESRVKFPMHFYGVFHGRRKLRPKATDMATPCVYQVW